MFNAESMQEMLVDDDKPNKSKVSRRVGGAMS